MFQQNRERLEQVSLQKVPRVWVSNRFLSVPSDWFERLFGVDLRERRAQTDQRKQVGKVVGPRRYASARRSDFCGR